MGAKGKEMKNIKDLPPSTQIEIYLSTDPDGQIHIVMDPFDRGYNVIVDETALKSLNATLSEKLAGHSTRSPNVPGYIKDYCMRWIDEMWSQGLVFLENAADKD